MAPIGDWFNGSGNSGGPSPGRRDRNGGRPESWHEQIPVVHRSVFVTWAAAMTTGMVVSFTSGEAVSREDLLRVLDAMHYALKAEQHHHRLLMQTEGGALAPAPDPAVPEEAR